MNNEFSVHFLRPVRNIRKIPGIIRENGIGRWLSENMLNAFDYSLR
jgi:hypothetical protein